MLLPFRYCYLFFVPYIVRMLLRASAITRFLLRYGNPPEQNAQLLFFFFVGLLFGMCCVDGFDRAANHPTAKIPI